MPLLSLPPPLHSCIKDDSLTVFPRRSLETTYWRKETAGQEGAVVCEGVSGLKASWAERRVECGTVLEPCVPGRRLAGEETMRCEGFPAVGWMGHLRGNPDLKKKGKKLILCRGVSVGWEIVISLSKH